MGDELVLSSNVDTVHLVARSPAEMQTAQADLKAWLVGKVASVKAEVLELKAAVQTAIQNKWASKTLTSQLSRASQRLVFYQKTLMAVDSGYCIIPNFPIDVFAVRVKREQPRHAVGSTTSEWGDAARNIPDEKPQISAAGEGHYVNPSQRVRRWSEPGTDDKGNKIVTKYAETADFGEIEFPIIAAQSSVMDATSQAMALKLFDRIGICPQSRPKGDPLIIGQILLQKTGWQDHKTVIFIIAWHLDLRTL